MRRCKPLCLGLFGAVCCQLVLPTNAAASLISGDPKERQPLDLTTKAATHGGGSSSLLRTVVGLLIVLALIWGLAWVLKRIKEGGKPAPRGGIQALASLPLGSGRSVQLIKAGSDYVLVGVADHAVFPLHRYTEQEARAAGLLELSPDNPLLAETSSSPFGEREQGLIDRLRRWTVRG
jgi:flagellar protein FliO/FliZ